MTSRKAIIDEGLPPLKDRQSPFKNATMTDLFELVLASTTIRFTTRYEINTYIDCNLTFERLNMPSFLDRNFMVTVIAFMNLFDDIKDDDDGDDTLNVIEH